MKWLLWSLLLGIQLTLLPPPVVWGPGAALGSAVQQGAAALAAAASGSAGLGAAPGNAAQQGAAVFGAATSGSAAQGSAATSGAAAGDDPAAAGPFDPAAAAQAAKAGRPVPALPEAAGEHWPTGADESQYAAEPHLIDLKRWGIRNDGERPVQTTQGINRALRWAAKSGITAVTLPPGTYTIDKNSRINMVGNMLFQLSDDTVLQKETNGKETYQLMYIGYGADNVTLRGGVYKGDKDSHDYSKKESLHSSGAHEGGYGISVIGAQSVTIDGVRSTHFTGDGLMLGGHVTLVRDLYENSFESGGIGESGKPVADKTRIRTAVPLRFDHAIFERERVFELSNPVHLPGSFDIYFYNKSDKLLERRTQVRMRDLIDLPDGADYAHLVFKQAGAKGAYVEFWNRTVASNVVVKNSEFAYNRRQGITVGGADRTLIWRNELHHIKGTAPQSGIDVEGGFGENGNRNSRIFIVENKFHHNASYDLILYDGRDAVVAGNHMASKGVIGLSVSAPFSGALVINNHFDGTRIYAARDTTLIHNRMNDSITTFEGPNIAIDGMTVTDGTFAISAKQPYGVTARNIKIESRNNNRQAGLALWGKPVRISDIVIEGESALRTVTGNIEPGAVIDRLKVKGYNSDYGLSLPAATYNNCEFEGAEGKANGAIGLSLPGKYVFNNCTFKASSTARTSLHAEHPKLDLTIRQSTFELAGNTSAVSVQAAASVVLEHNVITASGITRDNVELIKLNDYWKREEKHDILKAVIRHNTIAANREAIGISTVYAGTDAPPYTVEDNTLKRATLALKRNDRASGNIVED